jgi:hypothetical protein
VQGSSGKEVNASLNGPHSTVNPVLGKIPTTRCWSRAKDGRYRKVLGRKKLPEENLTKLGMQPNDDGLVR